MYVYIYTLEVGCWLMLVVHYSTFFFSGQEAATPRSVASNCTQQWGKAGDASVQTLFRLIVVGLIVWQESSIPESSAVYQRPPQPFLKIHRPVLWQRPFASSSVVHPKPIKSQLRKCSSKRFRVFFCSRSSELAWFIFANGHCLWPLDTWYLPGFHPTPEPWQPSVQKCSWFHWACAPLVLLDLVVSDPLQSSHSHHDWWGPSWGLLLITWDGRVLWNEGSTKSPNQHQQVKSLQMQLRPQLYLSKLLGFEAHQPPQFCCWP